MKNISHNKIEMSSWQNYSNPPNVHPSAACFVRFFSPLLYGYNTVHLLTLEKKTVKQEGKIYKICLH